jgi:arogenate/prephenate dehydratase
MTGAEPLRLAYQGEPGAYSELASREFYDLLVRDSSAVASDGKDAVAFSTREPVFVPCPSFTALFDAVAGGSVDRAVVPIENSLAGTIHANLDLLLRHPGLSIVGEHDFRVRHCLLGKPGVKLADVRVVRSHYMALAQCTGFLMKSGLVPEVAADTAGSAMRIRDEDLRDAAAIASRGAATLYGLNIIAENIEDEHDNYTRFLILSTSPNGYRQDLPAKTSIAFTLLDKPGALFRALSVFAVLDANLTKVESRHIHTVLGALSDVTDVNQARRWGYVFYVDFSESVANRAVQNALDNLKLVTPFFRLLGSYRRHVRD